MNFRKLDQSIIATKEVNITLLVKYSKPHFHAHKQKHKPKTNHKHLKEATWTLLLD